MTFKTALILLLTALIVAGAVVVMIELTGRDVPSASSAGNVTPATTASGIGEQSRQLKERAAHQSPLGPGQAAVSTFGSEWQPHSVNEDHHGEHPGVSSEVSQRDEEKSEAVKNWETETYFPKNDEEYGFYTSRSDDDLRRLAENGDPIAQKEWGSRLALGKKRFEDGVDWLIEAASHGSQYALSELIILHQLDSPIEDTVAAKAWAHVAFMLGNWQIAFTVPHLYTDPGSLEDRAVVGALAATFYEELNRRHVQRVGEPLLPRLRPGYHEMLNYYLNQPIESGRQ